MAHVVTGARIDVEDDQPGLENMNGSIPDSSGLR
jgi:hypothetical protein